MVGIVRFWVVLFGVLVASRAAAAPFLEVETDPAVPSLEEVIGHAPGERITRSDDAVRYLEALEAAMPGRIKLETYARSWQGRPLIYAVISSAENMARLETIKTNLATLAAGDGLSRGEIAQITERTPAVTWLSYGVHGDEISTTDAALALAHHLLAARNDAVVDKILAETIVVIDPNQNPDGRDRFVHSFVSALGLEALADRYTAEHDQPWPRGRLNHYLFDMNRDWFALTQPETRGRVKAILEWHPVVVVDAHEMGGDQSFFFPPAAEPFNPNITDAQRQKQVLIGRNHARWFDNNGIDFFTREIFDAFYPGYGDMWPTLNGAIAMTYEQGSARGLRFTKNDGRELTYREGVKNHFIATLSTAEVVADNKDRFLTDYAAYRASAVADGRNSTARYFVIDLATRRWQAERLGRRLAAQGVKVVRVEGPAAFCGVDYRDGALVVDRAQPNGRLISTLLDRNTPLPDEFMAEQENRRDRGLDHELYDVTAWSLPLMDGVAVSTCGRIALGGAEPLAADAEIPARVKGTGQYGYAVPWSDAGQAKLVLAALAEGLTGKATEEAFVVNGRRFPKGTAVFTTAANSPALGDRLRALATRIGAEVVALGSSWVEDGPNYGSAKFRSLKTVKIAMAWGEGVNPLSAGATRYVIERDLGVPVSPIRTRTIARANLDLYDAVIVPEVYFGFQTRLGKGGAAALKAFVDRGGVLIGFGSAVDALADDPMDLLSTTRETAFRDDDDESPPGDDDAEDGPMPGTRIEETEGYRALIADRKKSPEDVPGVLVKVVADPDHWLASGYEEATALLTGRRIYRPLNEADGTNVFRFAGTDDLLTSGYLWEENRLQLAYKPFVMAEPHGDGLVIAFTQSPTTRAYLNGLTLLLANAFVLGPAHTD